MERIDARLVGQKIARYRKAVRLTQAQLAEKVNVQPETISRIETGSRGVSFDLIVDVSAALDLELHELLRPLNVDDPRERALERLLWFASRLSPAEIELVIDIGVAVLGRTRRQGLE